MSLFKESVTSLRLFFGALGLMGVTGFVWYAVELKMMDDNPGAFMNMIFDTTVIDVLITLGWLYGAWYTAELLREHACELMMAVSVVWIYNVASAVVSLATLIIDQEDVFAMYVGGKAPAFWVMVGTEVVGVAIATAIYAYVMSHIQMFARDAGASGVPEWKSYARHAAVWMGALSAVIVAGMLVAHL